MRTRPRRLLSLTLESIRPDDCVYEFLDGELVRQAPTSLVVDVGGVGYALTVPLGTQFESSTRVRVWTHLVIREDAHTLYGFSDCEQRDFFRLLLSVRGVGPSVALMLLSSQTARDLVVAIQTEDREALTRIKGVGKKTAEQILLDLRERVSRLAGEHPFTDAGESRAAPGRDGQLAEAVSALVSIGYKEKEAIKLVEKAARADEDLDVEHLIRAVLRG